MKIPSSPLLITLALSTSTLAFPTPNANGKRDKNIAARSPNPEESPLLGTNDKRDGESQTERDAWGGKPATMPGRLSRGWGKRQTDDTSNDSSDTVTAQDLGSTVSGLTNGATSTVDGLLNGTPLEGPVSGVLGSVDGLVGGLLNGSDPSSTGPVTGLLKGLGLGGLLGNVEGTVDGLPVVGGLLGGIIQNLDVNPDGTVGNTDLTVDQLSQMLPANAATSNLPVDSTQIPQQGLSIVANLGGGLVLTSAGTIINLGQGVTSDPTSLPGTILNAGQGVASDPASLPGTLAGTAEGQASSILGQLPLSAGDLLDIPVNTAQGAVDVPVSAAQGVINTGTGTAQGTAGQLVNIGGQLVPLSTVLGLIGQATGTASAAANIPASVAQGAVNTGTGTAEGAAGQLVNIGGQLVPLSTVLGLIGQASGQVDPADMIGLASPQNITGSLPVSNGSLPTNNTTAPSAPISPPSPNNVSRLSKGASMSQGVSSPSPSAPQPPSPDADMPATQLIASVMAEDFGPSQVGLPSGGIRAPPSTPSNFAPPTPSLPVGVPASTTSITSSTMAASSSWSAIWSSMETVSASTTASASAAATTSAPATDDAQGTDAAEENDYEDGEECDFESCTDEGSNDSEYGSGDEYGAFVSGQ